MPNSIIRELLGCFGMDCLVDQHTTTNRQVPAPQTHNPAPCVPAYVPPAARPSYIPGRHYTIAELSQFASNNLPSAANRTRFLADLRDALLLPETDRPNKAKICKHLANLMTDQDALDCHGATRQGNYFASYCVDLTLQELEQQYSAAMENDLRDVLTLWVNTLCPGQSNFNLNGVIYSRQEVLDMLKSPSLISRQIQNSGSSLALQLDRRLRGQGTSSQHQTVHDPAVQHNGNRVLNIMREKSGQAIEPSQAEVRSFIASAAQNHRAKTAIMAGLTRCLNNTIRDANWQVNLTPQQTIKEVVRYIRSIQDNTMRGNLTSALLERLREIDVEGPCVSGILQRLVDVPNGIDPDMNFAGAARQIGEDMATLAGKTHAQFTELIDEGMQAIEDEKHDKQLTQTIAGNIGREMFETRVNQDMKLMQGLPAAQLAPHLERLKAGFD